MILNTMKTCKNEIEMDITYEYEKPEHSTGFKGSINIIDIDVQIPENDEFILALEMELLEEIKMKVKS